MRRARGGFICERSEFTFRRVFASPWLTIGGSKRENLLFLAGATSNAAESRSVFDEDSGDVGERPSVSRLVHGTTMEWAMPPFGLPSTHCLKTAG